MMYEVGKINLANRSDLRLVVAPLVIGCHYLFLCFQKSCVQFHLNKQSDTFHRVYANQQSLHQLGCVDELTSRCLRPGQWNTSCGSFYSDVRESLKLSQTSRLDGLAAVLFIKQHPYTHTETQPHTHRDKHKIYGYNRELKKKMQKNKNKALAASWWSLWTEIVLVDSVPFCKRHITFLRSFLYSGAHMGYFNTDVLTSVETHQSCSMYNQRLFVGHDN